MKIVISLVLLLSVLCLCIAAVWALINAPLPPEAKFFIIGVSGCLSVFVYNFFFDT